MVPTLQNQFQPGNGPNGADVQRSEVTRSYEESDSTGVEAEAGVMHPVCESKGFAAVDKAFFEPSTSLCVAFCLTGRRSMTDGTTMACGGSSLLRLVIPSANGWRLKVFLLLLRVHTRKKQRGRVRGTRVEGHLNFNLRHNIWSYRGTSKRSRLEKPLVSLQCFIGRVDDGCGQRYLREVDKGVGTLQ